MIRGGESFRIYPHQHGDRREKAGLALVMQKSAWWNVIGLAWLLFPALCVAGLLMCYHVNVPTQDDWWVLPQIQDFLEGRFRVASVWRPINEHRVFFPELLIVIFSPLTHWNIVYQLFASVALSFGACVVILRHTTRGLAEYRVFWQMLIFMTSVTVFTLAQNHAWLVGGGVYLYLARFAAIAGFSVLAAARGGKGRLAVAMLLGVVASYSFGTGLNYWVSALPVLLIGGGETRRLPRLALWLAATAATIALYLYDYRFPDWTPRTGIVTHGTAIEWSEFVLAYLGAALFPRWLAAAVVAGALGVMICLVASLVLLRSGARTSRDLAFTWSCALFAVTCACLTAIGRVRFGMDEALSRRYIPNSCLLWVADITLLIELAAIASRGKELRAAWGAGALAVLAVVCFPFCYASGRGIVYFQWNHDYMLEARKELVEPKREWILKRLLPDTEFVKASVPVMRRYKLSVFEE